ncbi:MAG: hypothetical protein NUV91_05165 [Candidatus Omnitrophica bacterium]|nr:hypothetical protein [Candidatus Omnitrophota bacterium]
MIKVNRQKIAFKQKFSDEDAYMDASPADRVAFIWELTQEIWSLKDPKIAQRRLQRHITKLIKK